MDTTQLLLMKEQIRTQVNKIIQEEGDEWWDITSEEKLVKQRLLRAVEYGDDIEILIVARDYADVLVRKQIIHEELRAKYEPELAQMQSINQQLKSQGLV